MLNEKELAKKYLYSLDVNHKVTDRFKYNVCYDHKSIIGIKSLLTYAARYYLYEKKFNPNDIRYLLSAYCGTIDIEDDDYNIKDFDPQSITNKELKDEIEVIKNKIPDMLNDFGGKNCKKQIAEGYDTENGEDKADKSTSPIGKLSNNFIENAKKYNYNNPLNQTNSNEFTSFIRIISNAIALGPLNNYYVCIPKDKLDNLITGEIWNSIDSSKFKAQAQFDIFEHIIKTLGVYYLSKLQRQINTLDKQEYALVYVYDLGNYYNEGIFNNGYLKDTNKTSQKNSYKYFESFKPASNINLIYPCEPLIELNTQLVKEDDFENNRANYKDYYIFRDIDASTNPLEMSELDENYEFVYIDQKGYIENIMDKNKPAKKKDKEKECNNSSETEINKKIESDISEFTSYDEYDVENEEYDDEEQI